MTWKSILVPKGYQPTALTTGLCIFIWLLYFVNMFYDINKIFVLSPSSLKNLELSRLSLYPLVHISFIHAFLNTMALFVPLTIFESRHGTVRTGVILNLLSVFTGVIYCIIGMKLFPSTHVSGLSGWWFSFLGYFSVKESQLKPYYTILTYRIPTLYFPVLLLLLSVLVPNCSFWGHAISLFFGYLLGYKESWFNKLTPPKNVIIKLESVFDRLISLIPSELKYIREQDVDNLQEYTSVYSDSGLPLHNENFQGQGRVLNA